MVSILILDSFLVLATEALLTDVALVLIELNASIVTVDAINTSSVSRPLLMYNDIIFNSEQLQDVSMTELVIYRIHDATEDLFCDYLLVRLG